MGKEMRQQIEKFNKFKLTESENLNISFMIKKFLDYLDSKKMGKEIRGYSNNVINLYDYNFSIRNYTPFNHHEIFMNWWNEEYETETISKNTILNTTQPIVSKTFINKMKSYSDKPVLVKVSGSYWVIDGHHRLVFDRMNNRDTECRVIKKIN